MFLAHPGLAHLAAVLGRIAVRGCGLLGFSLPGVSFLRLRDSDSIMNFSPNGALHCVCEGRHAGAFRDDRRQSCRACGHAVVSFDAELLDRELSEGEIAAHVRLLRTAGARARDLDIPAEVTDVYQLQAYLDANHGKQGRKPPRRPNAAVSAPSQVLAR